MEIKELFWDSDYFGFKVAEVKIKNYEKISPNEIVHHLNHEQISLAYLRSKHPLPDIENENYLFQYVTTRIPLIKKVESTVPFHPNISIYGKKTVDPNLIKLAELTGRVGRFGEDPQITIEQCDGIFRNLIVNSIKGNLATDVLVYKEKDEIIGFCTIKILGNEGYSPIIGVFPEYVGKGVGLSLMQAVERYLINNNCSVLTGGTQDTNEKALKAFTRFGFDLGDPEYTYHIWRKDKINNYE